MAKTLALCSSWSLLALGAVVTGYFILPRSTMEFAWLAVTVWTFVPFVLLVAAVRAAHSLGRQAIVLATTLLVVCYGFSVYFDRTFVHWSSIDMSPIEVPLLQALVSVAVWLFIRRRRQLLSHENR